MLGNILGRTFLLRFELFDTFLHQSSQRLEMFLGGKAEFNSLIYFIMRKSDDEDLDPFYSSVCKSILELVVRSDLKNSWKPIINYFIFYFT